MKIQKIVYWVATILFCGLILFSASMYLTKTNMVKDIFESLDYPTYIVIPLAVLKILGVIMLLWRKSPWLTEWAYAGFFFNIVLASSAHYHAGENTTLTLVAIILLLVSYFFGKVVRA